jgi:hypothetical protein
VYKKIEAISKNKGEKFKACLIGKCYSQKKVNYNDIFFHVVRHTFITVVLCLVAHFDIQLEQMDVKIDFIHSDLDEQIYMVQSERFIQPEQEITL